MRFRGSSADDRDGDAFSPSVVGLEFSRCLSFPTGSASDVPGITGVLENYWWKAHVRSGLMVALSKALLSRG